MGDTMCFSKHSFLKLFLLFAIIFSYIDNTSVFAEKKIPEITSEAAILIDSHTEEILFDKNMMEPMYPASITKIVTAIIAIETQDLNDIVTVSSDAVRAIGTRVYLLEDEEITLEQLLQGLMVSSGNDAAIAIAEHIDGSVEAFSDRMNDFVRTEVGVSDITNFTNPHGLFEEDHVTTAYDMAKISAYAMKNETFRELVGTHSVEWVGEGWETIIYNHHPLTRSYDEVIGIKNGFVRMSGYTLSTAAIDEHIELISVTLNSPSRNFAQKDTLTLLDYGFSHYETQVLTFEDEPLLKEYIYPDSVAVTSLKGEEIDYSIENGLINITGKENRLITTVELDERERIELPTFLLDPRKEKTEELMDQRERVWWLDWIIITGFNPILSNFNVNNF
ncbi:D-alanyl-D-alanine carboxypeptidase family protein [Evansella cellulosilytica]|uniref:Peptidase S11 D-alanyl-D-alanine carboxypeptidase 1 n=1 Tax=Evansella cellulosilytica (strain ATCC 21833 / DSM 2522 / FERM P-1141 / JCM 9156 / N-4) TaxID=649639 RepID=E6U0A0_EVAC2|nr:D-alanyl-D-alanine carboxypeptidase family protein [Evansella cellulosilytica]ADU30216.1 peptidase S11 D-alanyl-D-alanine carboxypeptidase 1 [Evansella cellulosilytica DSM 2522]